MQASNGMAGGLTLYFISAVLYVYAKATQADVTPVQSLLDGEVISVSERVGACLRGCVSDS